MNRKRISTAGQFARRHPRFAFKLGVFAFRHRASIKKALAAARAVAAFAALVRGFAPGRGKPDAAPPEPARRGQDRLAAWRRGIIKATLAASGTLLAARRLKRR